MTHPQVLPPVGTILIVDDTPANSRLLSQMLAEQGYKVRVANNGAQALQSVQANPPDLILLDIIMPEMDGYEVCKALRSRKYAHAIPIIFISALGATEDKINAFAVGGVDYITKPFQPEEVLARVEVQLALRATRQKLEGKNRQLEQEIVARKQTEAALQQSNARFRALVETTSDWIWETDKYGTFTYVSPKIRELLGHEPDEMIGKTPFDLMPPAEVARVSKLFNDATVSLKPFENIENINLHKNGAHVILETCGVPIFDEEHNFRGYRGIDRDITERKRAEDRLRENVQRYRALFDHTLDAVFLLDMAGNHLVVNQQAADMLGYTLDEIVGLSYRDIVAQYEHNDSEKIKEILLAGESIPIYERVFLHKDGREVQVEINLALIKDSHGRPLHIQSVARDITQRKRQDEEIRQLNQELERRVQMRTAELEAANHEMDSFQYSASHDLRTPLRGIDGYAQVILEDYADLLDAAGQDYLLRIRKGAQRMGVIIDDMLRMSRITQHQLYLTGVDLSAIAQNFALEFQLAEPQRKFEFAIDATPPTLGDEYLLTIALENLLENAVKFSRHQEITQIRFGLQEMAGVPTFFIADNGAGFKMEYQRKLFDAFQRLHRAEEYEGRGVGLAIVSRIIARHQGKIWAEAKENRGATFYFTLGSAEGD